MTARKRQRKLSAMDEALSPADTPGYDFLHFVLSSLVEDKEQLSIETKIDELGVLLTATVSERDMGKLIGKGGQTIKALRILLRVIGGNMKQRINLKLLEPSQ